MRAVEVLDNLKGFVGWEYSSYHMSKDEADKCIEALTVLKNLEEMTEGKEDGEKTV